MNTTTQTPTPTVPPVVTAGPVKITIADGRTFEGPTYKDARRAMSKALRSEKRLARRARNRSAAGEQECYAWIGRMYCNPEMELKVVVEGGGDGYETAFRANKLEELIQDELKGEVEIEAIAIEGDTAWAVLFGDVWYVIGRSRKDEPRAHMEVPEAEEKRLEAAAAAAIAKRDAAEVAAVEAAAAKKEAKAKATKK